MIRRRSIRSYLVVLVTAAVMPPLLFGLFSYFREFRLAESSAESEVRAVAQVTAANVEQFLGDLESILTALAERPQTRALDSASCDPVSLATPGLLPVLGHVMVMDEGGAVVCTTLPPPEDEDRLRDASMRPYYLRIMDGTPFHVGTPRMGYVSGRNVSVMSVPITGEDGGVAGAVALSVDLVRLQSLLAESSLPGGALITIADTTGVVVARSAEPDTWVGDTLYAPEQVGHFAVGPGTARWPGMDGVERLWGFAPVASAGWVVYAGHRLDAVRLPARRAGQRSALLALLTLVLVGGVSLYVHRRVTGDLSYLVSATEGALLGEGQRVSLPGVREIASVADHFNRALDARESAETERAAAARRYASVVENTSVGVVQVTEDGEVLVGNPAFQELLSRLGLDGTESVVVADLHVEKRDWVTLRDALLGGGAAEALDTTWRGPGGDSRVVRISGSTGLDLEGRRVLDLVVDDISDQTRMQQALHRTQTMEALGRLAGGVAHDFNNLLTVISGQAELLAGEIEKGEADGRRVEQILGASERAARLTSQLLAVGRIQPMTVRVTTLGELVAKLQPLLRSVVGEGHELRLEVDPEPPQVSVDPSRMDQVILNLVLNARDALSTSGRIIVRVGTGTISPDDPAAEVLGGPGDYPLLEVEDDGVGMDASTLDRIFEPFFTTKGEGKGTGLGLAQVYGIVTQFGGTVQAYSEVGRGTRVRVLLPRVSHTAPEAAPDTGQGLPVRGDAGGTILVAEDEDQVRRLIQTVLESAGYEVLAAANGAEALELARDQTGRIDLLLTDVIMPGIRGDVLAERIREDRPGIAVCFMSGYARSAEGEVAVPAGAPFLAKPFRPAELLRVVGELVARSRA